MESKIAWSEKQDRKKKKLERIRKKDLKRANEEEVDNDEKEADDDEDDLEADYRLLKKIKRVSFSLAVISTCLISFHLFFFCRNCRLTKTRLPPGVCPAQAPLFQIIDPLIADET